MVNSYVNASEAADIQSAFRALEDTIQTVFWDVTWVSWTKDRPATGAETWDNGKKAETWTRLSSGDGRLKANGSGGPVIGEAAIWQQAPYRLRTDVAAGLTANMWLVIGTRLFKVEHFEDRSGARQHATAYLSEVFGMALPEVTPVDDDEVTP